MISVLRMKKLVPTELRATLQATELTRGRTGFEPRSSDLAFVSIATVQTGVEDTDSSTLSPSFSWASLSCRGGKARNLASGLPCG